MTTKGIQRPMFPSEEALLALQGGVKVNGFLSKPISPLWVEKADRRHGFPDKRVDMKRLKEYQFSVMSQHLQHTEGPTYKDGG